MTALLAVVVCGASMLRMFWLVSMTGAAKDATATLFTLSALFSIPRIRPLSTFSPESSISLDGEWICNAEFTAAAACCAILLAVAITDAPLAEIPACSPAIILTPAEYRLTLANAEVIPLAVDLHIAMICTLPLRNTATMVVIPDLLTATI